MKRFALMALLLAAPLPFAAGAQSPRPSPQARYEQSLSPRAISAVQQRLRQLGFYRGSRDGAWGPRTVQAVASFQTSRSLPSNGELNPPTISALGLDPNNLSAAATYRR